MNQERGFTIVEVLIAVLVLTVGLLGLASTAGYVTRMVAQGDRYTEAATMASRRFEILRSKGCASMSDSTATYGQYKVQWTVTSIVSGKARSVQLTVTSPTGRGTRTDSFTNTIVC